MGALTVVAKPDASAPRLQTRSVAWPRGFWRCTACYDKSVFSGKSTERDYQTSAEFWRCRTVHKCLQNYTHVKKNGCFFFRESACTGTAESKTSLPPHWVRLSHSMRERSLLLEQRASPHDPNTHNCHNARALSKSTVPINFPHLKFFQFLPSLQRVNQATNGAER